jgi:hypothetical protein
MMSILMPETCWGNKTAYFVASSWFFTFHYVYDARSHEDQICINVTLRLVRETIFAVEKQ